MLISAMPCTLPQIIAGSLSFFISRQQTSRHYLEDAMQYGGAQYIATGRGVAIKASPFLKREGTWFSQVCQSSEFITCAWSLEMWPQET